MALAGDFLAGPFLPFLGLWTCPPLAGETGAPPIFGGFGAEVGDENVETFFNVPLAVAPYDVALVESIVSLSGNELLTYCVYGVFPATAETLEIIDLPLTYQVPVIVPITTPPDFTMPYMVPLSNCHVSPSAGS